MFADEREDESTLHWFLIISVLVHALLIWLWPQWQAMTVTGVGLDAGGVIEIVTLPGEPSLQPQPPRPGQPVPAVAQRPRPQQEPVQQQQQQAPAPQPEPVVRPAEQRVEPVTPTQPQVQPRPQPQPAPQPEPQLEPKPEPEPAPLPEPERLPEPVPEPEPEPEQGVGEEVLVSERGEVEISATRQPEPQPVRPAPAPVQPQPLPQPEPEPRPQPEPAGPQELVPAPEGPAASEPSGEGGEEQVQQGEAEATDPDGAPEAAPSLATLATRYGLGSTKSLENVPPEERLNDLVIELAVDSQGRVLTYSIVSSSGRPDVDLEMAGLMMRWQFAPYERNYVEIWRITFTHTVVGGVTTPLPQPEFVGRR